MVHQIIEADNLEAAQLEVDDGNINDCDYTQTDTTTFNSFEITVSNITRIASELL